MNIRLATVEDIPAISALRMEMLREVAGELPENLPEMIEEYLSTHIKDGSCLCALMEEDGRIIAKAMACLGRSVPDEININGRYAILGSVYTRPQYRGEGRMGRLLARLLEWTAEEGVSEVYAAPEKKALSMYKRLGFEFIENQMIIRL